MPSTWVDLVWLWYWKTKRKYFFSSCHRTIINPLGGLFRLKCWKASYMRVTKMFGFDERILSIPVSSLYYYYDQNLLLQRLWHRCRLKIDRKLTLLKNFFSLWGSIFQGVFSNPLGFGETCEVPRSPSKCSPDPVMLNFSVRMRTGVSNLAWSVDASINHCMSFSK